GAPGPGGWVLSRPRSAVMDGGLVAQGDARLTRGLGTTQIARQFADAWQERDVRGAGVGVFGHSHFARTWRKPASAAPAELLGARAALEAEGSGCRYFVNVGTTGLPFPGKAGPTLS